MIRLGNFKAAYKAAEKVNDDRMLLSLGKLALVDFFDKSHYINNLGHAIESVKRVQGDLKPQAEEMLYDLAMEITSPEFTRTKDGSEFMHNYALRALRVTGELLERKPGSSSGEVDFLTKVTDERYVSAIRNIVRVVMTQSRRDLDEVRKSLVAIGDSDTLNQYAEEIFSDYSEAIDFLRAASRSYVDEVFASVPQTEGMPDYVHSALVEEQRLRNSLGESRTTLTPERRQELVAQGYECLEQGDSWNAYECFKDALFRKGLIDAGDKMLEQNNGLNAKRVYLCASLLPTEDHSLPNGIERKLLE